MRGILSPPLHLGAAELAERLDVLLVSVVRVSVDRHHGQLDVLVEILVQLLEGNELHRWWIMR